MSGAAVERRIVEFVRLLRHNGFALGIEETLDALRVADAIDLARPAMLRSSLRALLSSTDDEWRRFDDIFELFWRGRGAKQAMRSKGDNPQALFGGRPLGNAPPGPPTLIDRSMREEGGDTPLGGEGRREGATSDEALGATDLRRINDPEEMARVHRLAERLALRM